MRVKFYALLAASVLSLSIGSAHAIEGRTSGGKPFPEASAGFVPKQTYDVDANQLWGAMLSALSGNSIAIASAVKDAGQLTTDYIEGQQTTYLGGLGGYSVSRYKYTFFVVPEGAQTRLNIKAILESSHSGFRTSTTGFRDLSGQNPKVIEVLTNWMYQQIEQRLGL